MQDKGEEKYTCKKLRFVSILEAKKGLRLINIRFKKKGIEPLKSYYLCDKCYGYHLATNRSSVRNINRQPYV